MIQTQRTLYQNVIITLVGYSTHCFPTEYNGSTPNPGRSANPYGVVMVQPSHGGNLMSFIRNSTAAPCSCGQPQIVASSSCRFTVVPRRTRVPDRASTTICKQFWASSHPSACEVEWIFTTHNLMIWCFPIDSRENVNCFRANFSIFHKVPETKTNSAREHNWTPFSGGLPPGWRKWCENFYCLQIVFNPALNIDQPSVWRANRVKRVIESSY